MEDDLSKPAGKDAPLLAWRGKTVCKADGAVSCENLPSLPLSPTQKSGVECLLRARRPCGARARVADSCLGAVQRDGPAPPPEMSLWMPS